MNTAINPSAALASSLRHATNFCTKSRARVTESSIPFLSPTYSFAHCLAATLNFANSSGFRASVYTRTTGSVPLTR